MKIFKEDQKTCVKFENLEEEKIFAKFLFDNDYFIKKHFNNDFLSYYNYIQDARLKNKTLVLDRQYHIELVLKH